MRVALTERFQRDAAGLASDQRTALFESMLALPRAIGNPHLHQGLGIRKLHAVLWLCSPSVLTRAAQVIG